MKTISQPTITFYSFSGWALERAARLDRQGSRGLIADILTASLLKRQAAFAVLANIDPDDPAPLSDVFLHTNYARDLIASAFRVDSVPSGYLRALIRIGHKPLAEPCLYRRLYDLLSDQTQPEKRHALRYCGPLDATRIRAVDLLDPVLVVPEVLGSIRNLDYVKRVNLLVGFLRQTCSTITDQAIRAGVRQALSAGGTLEEFAQLTLQKADRFPPPPLAYHPDLMPITSGAEMARLGQVMRNCLSSKVAPTLLGMAYFLLTQVDHDGESIPIVVELAPLSNSCWTVEDLHGPRNQRVPPAVAIPILRKLMAAGAVVGMNPDPHAKARELSRALCIPLPSTFDLLAWESGGPDTDVDDLDSEFAVVLADIEREFGLLA